MADNFQVRGQYRAAAQSVKDVIDNLAPTRRPAGSPSRVEESQVDALLAVALSNLAVAEAIHRVALAVEARDERPVVVNSTGSVTLDPDAVAEALTKIINREQP